MTNCLLATQLPMFRPMAKVLLEQLGFKVVVAVDGKDALAEFDQQIPDVVLMTDGLPPFGVEQTIRTMRDVEGGNAPKIIVIMRLDSLERVSAIRNAGANFCDAAPTQESIVKILRDNGLLKS